MAGYSADPTSNFNAVLDRLMTSLGTTEVIRFGQRQPGAPTAFEAVPNTKLLHSPAFYSYLNNPDAELYAHVARDTTPALHLYLTDGVQSTVDGANQAPTVKAIRRLFAAGRAVAVVGFHSSFRGKAWSEQAGRFIGTVQVQRRPFYVFVVAPSERAIDDLLLSKFSTSMQPELVLRFDPWAIQPMLTQHPSLTVLVTKPAKIFWLKPDRPTIRKALDTGIMYACFYSATSKLGTPAAHFLPRIDVKEWSLWSGSKFVPHRVAAPQASAKSILGAGSGGPSRAEIQLAVQPGDITTRDAFLALRLVPHSFHLNPEVRSWSADQDDAAASLSRTYRFEWLIEQLVAAQLDRTQRSTYVFLSLKL